MTDVGAVFDAGRAEFVDWSPLLWWPMGVRTAEAAGLQTGERVLDVCCGAGASALPAADLVGESGLVHGVDLATELLAYARKVANRRGLHHAEFHDADVTTWQAPDGEPYDVLQCAYGVFFLPEMDTAVARLVDLVRPGGRVVVTTWAETATEGFGGHLVDAVRVYKPELPINSPVNLAAQRINTEEKLTAWLTAFGLAEVEVRPVDLSIPINEELAWSFVLGTGMRARLDGLSDYLVEAVRADFLHRLSVAGIDHMDARSLIGVGTR
ncbi:2-polyprenyl-3-methyl-5-hydroxy-6-metoxy-1,4-benzoquinol methylase [Crossiella equi]|uniref:2-polyprenyl-3-methyl-5-hydroxy-6-metoxy-1, 4-benzoquinol methylase n=1 Tax=Crossiella equi TaxID=130796 RepID=A0ABS5A7Y5_9PSEU|nr:class I SAM-dependent methyltransferase [Crossiella equi]MBP2472696.1 2-polyprenyl-3-methyl-5-hydroxy-6-metoxy-1,4-benzoquinol methylase [Crossiella equi]